MAWPDAVLLSAFPMFLVMAVLAITMPAARPVRPWAGVGLAAVVALASGIAITVANWDSAGVDCAWRLIRYGGPAETPTGGQALCHGANPVSLWLAALPAILALVVLLGWVWRHTTPAALARRTAAIMVAGALAVVLLGQLNANLGLLALVLLVVGSYAWPRVRARFGEMRAASSG